MKPQTTASTVIYPEGLRRTRSAVRAVLLAVSALVAVCCWTTTARAAGPSFPCSPLPVDALDQLTCSDAALGSAEILMVQTYYALRQVVGPERQAPLRTEFLHSVIDTRARCGLPRVQTGRDQSGFVPSPTAAACVRESYDNQRSRWAARLSGPAAEEAARDPAANVAMQTQLRDLGLLSADTVPDGVFGTATRAAIVAWQRSAGRPETGFLGGRDAAALSNVATTSVALPQDSAPWAGMTVVPLAMAEYKGVHVVAASGDTSVQLAPGRSGNAALCAKGTGTLLPGVSILASNGGDCAVVTLTMTVSNKVVLEAAVAARDADTNPETLQIKVAVRRLELGRQTPEVVLQGFTGGAHCCTSTVVLTQGVDAGVRTVDLGMLDGDVGYAFLDPVHNGSAVLVSPAGEFNYAFASYSGSFATTRIQLYAGDGLQDVSKEPRFVAFQRAELRRMESSWLRSSHLEPNGYLSAWVAQKARVGEFDDAWRTMLRSYDRSSDTGLIDCSMDVRSSVAAKALGEYGCPKGYARRGTFPEALASFLTEHEYITRDQAKAVGFDQADFPRTRARNTVLFDERMDRTWFVIDAKGACVEPRPATSPADLVMAVRARGLDASVDTSEEVGGQPVVVSVNRAQADGLPVRTTFYRGAVKCSAVRALQQAELEKLK